MKRMEFWILALGMTGFAMCGGGIASGQRLLVAAGSAVAALGAVWSILRCHRSGLIRTSDGICRRLDGEAGFRLQLAYVWAGTAFWLLAGLLYGLRLIGTSP